MNRLFMPTLCVLCACPAARDRDPDGDSPQPGTAGAACTGDEGCVAGLLCSSGVCGAPERCAEARSRCPANAS